MLRVRQTAPLDDVALAHALQPEALLNALGEEGVASQAEALAEIERLNATAPTGR